MQKSSIAQDVNSSEYREHTLPRQTAKNTAPEAEVSFSLAI